jgi:multidrug resistance efflux pump
VGGKDKKDGGNMQIKERKRILPSEEEIASLKLAIKLNRIELEKTVIYAEQIKERLQNL